MTRFILIRHGQTEWNVTGRWQGQADPPLDEIGLRQAEALAEHLRGETFAAVYSSPLARARQTAEYLAHAQGLSVTLDARLRERNVGVWSGLTEAEVKERYPDHYRADWWVLGPPGGEAQASLMERTVGAFRDIVAAHAEATVAAVSHGGTLNAYLRSLFGIAPALPVTFRFTNASFARVAVKDGRVHVVSLGEVAHLQNEKLIRF
jgi:broad specificity phosphatase PhoE